MIVHKIRTRLYQGMRTPQEIWQQGGGINGNGDSVLTVCELKKPIHEIEASRFWRLVNCPYCLVRRDARLRTVIKQTEEN
jgi:hypothetical protein